jgi:type I restriction enzyme S subunit
MINTLEKMLRTIFKSWFLDRKIQEKKSVMGTNNVPAGWHVDKLGNLASIKGRIGWKGLQVSEYVGDGPYIIGGKQLINGHVNWDSCPKVTIDRYNESPEIMIRQGDILMTKDGTIGKLAYVDKLNYEATVASGIFVIRSKSSYIGQMYLLNYFRSESFQRLVESRIEGSVVPHLYQKDLIDLKVILPPLNIVQKFESLAIGIRCQIASCSQIVYHLKNMLDELLPRLISSEINMKNKIKFLDVRK